MGEECYSLETSLDDNEDIGIDAPGGQDDGNAPAMAKCKSQTEMLRLDPAPISTDRPIQFQSQSNSTWQ